MQSPENRKRAPAWTAREVLDLIAIWGEDSVLTELRSKRRNEKIFEKISKAMMEKGHTRDSVQCRVKVKELRQAYQKTKEANGRSEAGAKTCCFYPELHAILGGSATTTPPLSLDSEVGVVTSAMAEDSVDGEDDEEEEEDELAESTQHSVRPNSQELFLTQTELPSQATSPDSEAMEATSAAHFSSLPTPSRRLSQIRRRKKKTQDEMFLEIMEVTRNERAHLNKWKDVVSNYRKDANEREDRRDEREDRRDARDERWRQEVQRCRQEDQRWRDAKLGLLRDQTDILRRLVALQEEQQGHRVLLQPLCNHPHHSPCSMSSSPRRVRMRGGRLRAPAHSTPVDSPTKRLSLH
ncbi:adapter molecule crk isoform X1 [Gopherus flavomarginatus]|uniref:adapter molecule crk isoform X1 n=1 Tax=Gopherus flavomarginatus TaxID=286002 RepID=UPI0021CBE09A|nr:adapter molecule crk isoform X1 [Gopherus flavomarginatus]